jgi:hypothetical protein
MQIIEIVPITVVYTENCTAQKTYYLYLKKTYYEKPTRT